MQHHQRIPLAPAHIPRSNPPVHLTHPVQSLRPPRKIHTDILALHNRYGRVARIGPNELAFNAPQAFRDIYAARPSGSCFPKDRGHYEPPANGVDHLVCAIMPVMGGRHGFLCMLFPKRRLGIRRVLLVGMLIR